MELSIAVPVLAALVGFKLWLNGGGRGGQHSSTKEDPEEYEEVTKKEGIKVVESSKEGQTADTKADDASAV